MNKDMIKRLESLEVAVQAKRHRQEEEAKNLYVKLVNNDAVILGAKKIVLTGETPLGVVGQIEDYILKARPEKVTISVELSGICDLIPGLEACDEGREVDTYYVTYGGIMGDYCQLIEANKEITLANIILCEVLIPYLRGCKADEEMGVKHFFPNGALCLAHSLDLILCVLVDRVRKYKAYRAEYEANPGKFGLGLAPELPRNEWSRFWPANGDSGLLV
ncbi:MAG: hypothetical protein FWG94_12015 [Oscillospiraceae bacterium]|nr:hypothetical protein [Oscillospiraceae bacterium]